MLLCAGCATVGGDKRALMLDSFQSGQEAYAQGDYSQAIKLLTPAAEAGNPNAQFYLGMIYDFGRGVPDNHEKANEWYQQAAVQGQDDAMYNLAISYQLGEGIEQSDEMAVYWLGKSALTGDRDAIEVLTYDYAESDEYPEAQYTLAQLYRTGVALHNDLKLYPSEDDNAEIAPDQEEYEYWLIRAAENGHAQAVVELENLR